MVVRSNVVSITTLAHHPSYYCRFGHRGTRYDDSPSAVSRNPSLVSRLSTKGHRQAV